MKRALLILGLLILGTTPVLAGSCNPAMCVPLTGCTWRPTTNVCSNTNSCVGGLVHNIVTYANCTVGSCNAGCTPAGCAQANTPMSCGPCNQTSDTPTSTPCGSVPPPAPGPSCGDAFCDGAIGEDCASCALDCGLCGPPPPPPPPPACIPLPASCPIQACGMPAAGLDNCGNACSNAGPACPPPPMGPCGANDLCGTIKDGETSSVFLPGIPVEVRNASGIIIATVRTDSSGRFTFHPSAPGSYILNAVPDRTECIQPVQQNITLGSGNEANFKMLFTRGTLQVQDKPGTFVMFTLSEFTGTAPPPAPGPISVFSTVVGLDGLAKMRVPNHFVYWVTCWRYEGGEYVKTPSKQVTGTMLLPLEIVAPVSCI